jgi:hypothetical protein
LLLLCLIHHFLSAICVFIPSSTNPPGAFSYERHFEVL